jgi:hypothetical protein
MGQLLHQLCEPFVNSGRRKKTEPIGFMGIGVNIPLQLLMHSVCYNSLRKAPIFYYLVTLSKTVQNTEGGGCENGVFTFIFVLKLYVFLIDVADIMCATFLVAVALFTYHLFLLPKPPSPSS